MSERPTCSYIVPIRWSEGSLRHDLADYLARIGRDGAEVIVVDGSEAAVFEANAAAFGPVAAHLRPDAGERCLNGKVAGVRTGIRSASCERIVIGDDDVRYHPSALRRTVELLDQYDLVRPQNYFAPLPWHARLDTARTLVNRCVGRDFPGTLAVRRSRAVATRFYDGDVLFENLELIRTVRAGGGVVVSPLDLYVMRLPPSSSHFWGQRVRQAYDDFALPPRMAVWLSIPLLAGLSAVRRDPRPALAVSVVSIAAAECGRRRGGGARVFPATSSALAPLWLLERGVSSWIALGRRLRHGGVVYAGSLISTAAHSERELELRSKSERVSIQPTRTSSAPKARKPRSQPSGPPRSSRR